MGVVDRAGTAYVGSGYKVGRAEELRTCRIADKEAVLDDGNDAAVAMVVDVLPHARRGLAIVVLRRRAQDLRAQEALARSMAASRTRIATRSTEPCEWAGFERLNRLLHCRVPFINTRGKLCMHCLEPGCAALACQPVPSPVQLGSKMYVGQMPRAKLLMPYAKL